MRKPFLAVVVFMFVGLFCLPQALDALAIENPDEIELEALLSFGEDGAAWLRWHGHEVLVTSGFMIGTDLRVVAVRHDSVTIFRPQARQYHVIVPASEKTARKDRNPVIWTTHPVPVWKLARMVALAYRKDYIAHYSTTGVSQARAYGRTLEAIMDKVVDPHHRFYPRKGLIYVAPVHVHGHSWRHLTRRIQDYRSKTLAEWFPVLNEKSSIISNGRPLDQILQRIAHNTGVYIRWQRPVILPLYCSLRDRPWHEILEAIVVFNGLELLVDHNGLEVR